jgi:hypothetical protein
MVKTVPYTSPFKIKSPQAIDPQAFNSNACSLGRTLTFCFIRVFSYLFLVINYLILMALQKIRENNKKEK